jgi:hypothetical protein
MPLIGYPAFPKGNDDRKDRRFPGRMVFWERPGRWKVDVQRSAKIARADRPTTITAPIATATLPASMICALRWPAPSLTATASIM